ncbi:hypothetical protein NCCP2495_17450 [Dietzia sp. NCCP-2495]|nr:hypothetical protein NCCP2495_17450 [Dietzia sp. NCCP-2495]
MSDITEIVCTRISEPYASARPWNRNPARLMIIPAHQYLLERTPKRLSIRPPARPIVRWRITVPKAWLSADARARMIAAQVSVIDHE